MLPNVFPGSGDKPGTTTPPTPTLWFFELGAPYYRGKRRPRNLAQVFPILAEIVDLHLRARATGSTSIR